MHFCLNTSLFWWWKYSVISLTMPYFTWWIFRRSTSVQVSGCAFAYSWVGDGFRGSICIRGKINKTWKESNLGDVIATLSGKEKWKIKATARVYQNSTFSQDINQFSSHWMNKDDRFLSCPNNVGTKISEIYPWNMKLCKSKPLRQWIKKNIKVKQQTFFCNTWQPKICGQTSNFPSWWFRFYFLV